MMRRWTNSEIQIQFQKVLSFSSGVWNVFRPEQIRDILRLARPYFRFSWSNKKLKYYNVPCAFDIETSSWFEHGKKRACMYVWQFGIFGYVIIGRTWKQFVEMLQVIAEELQLNNEKRLLVGVHNLGYEFQFMRKWFTWEKVFATDVRKPIYALTDQGIEFRCTLFLSGYKLENVAKNLQTYKVKKAVGDLDYERIRHSSTPLTDTELGYCVDDVRIIMAYLQERSEADGGLAKVCLTKTGYVRKFTKNQCFYEDGVYQKDSLQHLRYRELMSDLTLSGPEEFEQLQRGFQGGFTHANPFRADKTITGPVTGVDFTSEYPSEIIARLFPMGRGERYDPKDKEDFKRCIKNYCCLFDVEIWGMESRIFSDSYLSRHKCRNLQDPIEQNGRIVSADHLCTTMTEQDWNIFDNFYTRKKVRITNFRRYKKAYLPTALVKAVLKLYADKTTLKGVDGMEAEYMSSKEMLNSVYGMMVTNIAQESYPYEDDWKDPVKPDLQEVIEKYNKNAGRFLFYPWGVWVTAYSRASLFTGIIELSKDEESDYIYADTDSIKLLNYEKHKPYFDWYNQTFTNMVEKACQHHGIDPDLTRPKTIKGVEKPIGVWDFDGEYSRFKTLGAKRYLVEYSDNPVNKADAGKVKMTVAGLSKQNGVKYLLEKYGQEKVFDYFTNHMVIPPDATGKMTHTYVDPDPDGPDFTGEVIDCYGIRGEYHEKSFIHLEKAGFDMTLSKEYCDYILGLREMEGGL